MMSQDGLSVIPSTIKGFAPEVIVNSNPNSNPNRRKRNLPGTPDPDAEIIALSPKSLMATNRFICEICNKGFQRDQNLQLHRRGHNLPWKLKQRNKNEVIRKKVYICPEKSCVHHEASRALGDLTGIKKHYFRKHGEKKWKCEKCSKKYAVLSDCKAHTKICGTREYKCDCGTLFSRKDSFITHRAFCDALTEGNACFSGVSATNSSFQNGNNFRNNNFNLQASRTISQLPSIFQPEYSAANSSDQSMGNNQRLNTKLPLWLVDPAEASTISHQLNSNALLAANYNFNTLPSHDQFLQTTVPLNMYEPSSLMSQTHQWLNNSKYPESTIPWNTAANNLSISSFPMVLKQEEAAAAAAAAAKGNLLYLNNINQNGQHQSSNTTPIARMSNTPTAQMGSTFGLINSFSINKNEADHDPHNNNNNNNNNNLNDLVSCLSRTIPTTSNSKQDQEIDETRDFLGVGGETTSGSLLIFQQELAKFANSMGDY